MFLKCFNSALAKIGSFGVVNGSAFSVAATPNVPLVRLPKKFKYFLCGGGVLIFLLRRHECRTV